MKFGGLRTGGGGLDIHLTREGDMIDMRWVEQLDPSRPPQSSASSKPGFGTQLIDLSVQQLGGDYERTFDTDRVSIRLRFPATT